MGGVEEDYNDDKDETQQDEDDELIKQISKDIRDSENHLRGWLDEAKSCYDYFAGNQWDEKDIATLAKDNRPVVVFNRIARTINAVSGLELQNRQEVNFSARQVDDNGASQVLSAAAKWARDNCDAEDEESEAFQDNLICGMGWTETRVEYDTNLNGAIAVDRIDPLMMRYDQNARKRNLDDRRWNALLKDMTREEFKEFWPDFDPQFATSYTENQDSIHDSTLAFQYNNDQSDPLRSQKSVRVIQYQYWCREKVYRVVQKDGSIEEFTEENFNKNKDFIESEKLTYTDQPKKIFKQVFINGKQILEQGKCPVDGFTFRCNTGLRNRNKNNWFGLVSLMKDPQQWANKWLSQIMFIINSNAKGGVMFESGSFRNIRQAEEQWSSPSGMIELNPGTLAQGKIQQREAPRYPDGIDKLLQIAMQNINDIPGVNLELLGVANREQAGYLEAQRKEAGVTILATFFDSLRRYRKEQGRILAKFIKQYISDGRLIKIMGKDGAKFVPIYEKQFDFEYDIIVDDSPTSPNMKDKIFSIISTLLPTLIQANIPIPPDIIDYAPIPEDLKEKWKAILNDPQKQQYEDQMKQLHLAGAQLDLEGKQKGIAESESKTILNQAKAQESGAASQDEYAQAMKRMGMTQIEQSSQIQQTQQDMQLKDAETLASEKRKELEFQLTQDRLNQEHQLKMQHSKELHAGKLKQQSQGGN
jgi:hypothetical protein